MGNYEIDDIDISLDFKSNSLNICKNGLMLTNYEIDILDKYNINYNSCTSLKEIIFKIEDILNDESFLDLEKVSLSISERDYYMNTNK